ncbi:hypothetical protein DTO027I6_8090 [Penicillium roqueforti]|nr:hypothetical protein CBS147337_6187 [Penicillium roqueforti]KAI2676017.1 hypothetical protein CBS147355_6198 [Penicillium roqueforti]KAI2679296.1 hypothetical protein LCP963914a_7395 [Penicillium roqueforti]KAI2707691.1 hypothetical protein CBS147332_6749 [Penicillium roqueforti]KAI3112169.1 hypothetical protein CBS147331_4723 [Penicillium roqueforti]
MRPHRDLLRGYDLKPKVLNFNRLSFTVNTCLFSIAIDKYGVPGTQSHSQMNDPLDNSKKAQSADVERYLWLNSADDRLDHANRVR